MKQPQGLQGTRRAAATMRELEKAKSNLNSSPVVVLARVALAVIYMYLIIISYEILGIAGPVFISTAFLIAFFAPLAYRIFTDRLRRNPEREQQVGMAREARQET